MPSGVLYVNSPWIKRRWKNNLMALMRFTATKKTVMVRTITHMMVSHQLTQNVESDKTKNKL